MVLPLSPEPSTERSYGARFFQVLRMRLRTSNYVTTFLCYIATTRLSALFFVTKAMEVNGNENGAAIAEELESK